MSERILEQSLEGEYSGYEHIIEQGGLYPQHQGMMLEDYEVAINDPNTCITEVETEADGLIRVPQLAAVKNFSWLNRDFYAEHFPEQMQKSEVLNFTEINDVEPSPYVKAGLRTLAQNGGVLTFDHPSSDPEYGDRLVHLLSGEGIKVDEEVDLGSQTYYVGKFRLNDGVDPGATFVNFRDSLAAIETISGVDGSHTGPSYMPEIDLDKTLGMQAAYAAAFKKVNNHPCRQDYTPEEFVETMTHQPEVAKVVYLVDDEIATVCLLGDELDKFDWINPDFYTSNFPVGKPESQFLYFPTLATDPNKKGMNYAGQVMAHICHALKHGSNEATVGFDCGDANKGVLNILIEHAVAATDEGTIHFNEVGNQEYKALKLSLA